MKSNTQIKVDCPDFAEDIHVSPQANKEGIGVRKFLFEPPEFFSSLYRDVLSWLKTFPTVRIWIAGCPSPQTLASFAITLQDGGISRWKIYVTDENVENLEKLRLASFSEACIRRSKELFQNAGGNSALRTYFSKRKNLYVLKENLQSNFSFFEHHLGVEGSINEFQLIYYSDSFGKKKFQNEKELKVLHESLSHFGLIGFGNSEFVNQSTFRGFYREIAQGTHLFKRVD
jgi:chemotaxis protein methyltransferase CheR